MTGPSPWRVSSPSSAGQMRSSYPRVRSSSLNWSTRLRRWVRISTPPVRDASTKPMAATVLPAPVACSNQKRLAALGSSTALWSMSSSVSPDTSSAASSSSSRSGGVVLLVVLVLLELLVERGQLGGHLLVLGGRGVIGVLLDREHGRGHLGLVDVDVAHALGEQGGERSGERVDLVGVQRRAVGEVRLLLAEQTLQAEQQRPVAAPTSSKARRARRRSPRARSRAPGDAGCPGPARRRCPHPGGRTARA